MMLQETRRFSRMRSGNRKAGGGFGVAKRPGNRINSSYPPRRHFTPRRIAQDPSTETRNNDCMPFTVSTGQR